eukprot:gene13731-16193_t
MYVDKGSMVDDNPDWMCQETGGLDGVYPYALAEPPQSPLKSSLLATSKPDQPTPVKVQIPWLPKASDRYANQTGTNVLIDWSQYTTMAKDQAGCSSCYIFTAVATLESRFLVKYGGWNNLDLSEQSVLNCQKTTCNGGWIGQVYIDQLAGGIGFELEDPYLAENQTCVRPKGFDFSTSRTWWQKMVQTGTKKQDFIEALKTGPIGVGMYAPDNLISYNTGIYKCDKVNKKQNHAVTLIGYDPVTDSWLLKNSWGPTWGEGGLFRMTASDDNCFLRGFAAVYPDWNDAASPVTTTIDVPRIQDCQESPVR